MCGIAGIIGSGGETPIESMTRVLSHRGPDSTGHVSQGIAHLGATRLSILDPDAAPQPVWNRGGHACIVFNGEIYNHKDLRSKLADRGYVFASMTDTEVVLHMYEEVGEACVHHLHGMFAFAILDRDRLFLARDRLGIKPLYHCHISRTGQFVFASEIKAILRLAHYNPALDLRALADSVVLGYALGEATLFEGIRLLPPGHTMTVYLSESVRLSDPRPYWSRNTETDEGMCIEDAEELLEAELARAVDSHLAADVEVGVTLSGGLDSTLLACLTAERLGRAPRTFVVGDCDCNPDVIHAEQVARLLGSTHETVVPSFDDYLSAIPSLVEAEEEPSNLFLLPLHLLCRRVGSRVKACLHGEGADELFGGYPDYLNRYSRLERIRSRVPRLRDLGVEPSDRLVETIERLSSPTTINEYLPQVFHVNLSDRLERLHLLPVDKCGMSASLELRVPYLDDGMVDIISRMPLRFLVRPDIGVRKYILRRLALKRFGLDLLDVVLREKVGAPRAGLHHLDRFDRLCSETLPDTYASRHTFGSCFSTKRELLMFDFFQEVFMKHRGNSEAAGGIVDFMASRAENQPVTQDI